MRAKKAKALKKIARSVSAGMPESRLLAKMVKNKRQVTSTVAANDPSSTRGIYRKLKADFKKGKITC